MSTAVSDDRQRRSEGVVAEVEELVRDHVAEHQRGAAAEDLRDHVLAGGRDRHQDAAGDDPGHGQRQNHPAQRAPGLAPRSEAASNSAGSIRSSAT